MLERIGHYRVLRKIGEGGMGEVYAARDERLDRVVAIKTIRAVSETANVRQRFWQEARSLARVNHPNICQIFEVAEEGGTLFLVLEMLEGSSLASRLKSGPMSFDDARDILVQILRALDALHSQGLVHRDLKPSNVFLTPHGVKLLDFGLTLCVATPFGNTENNSVTLTGLTVPGAIVGTPNYMAPEQIECGVVGPPADLFAAGCLLYEMLTGRHAFEANTTIGVLHTILHGETPKLRGNNGPAAVDEVIRHALEKRPEDRYASAKEMADALCGLAMADVGEQIPRTRQQRRMARFIALPFRILGQNEDAAFLAYSLPEAISSSLSGIDSIIVRSGLVAARFEGQTTDPRKIAAEAEVEFILTGTLLRGGDQLRVSTQLVEAPCGAVIWSDTAQFSMAGVFQLQDSLTNRIVQSLTLPLTDREWKALRRDVPSNARAYEYYLRANQISQQRSIENMRLARDLYLECVKEDPNYAPAWARLGRSYRFIEKFSEGSADNLRLADEAYGRAFALSPDLAAAHNFYTTIETDLGRAPEAMVRLLERAKHKRNDPELFAGLVQACRYSGELYASLEAHKLARQLDPNITTSVAHTHFLLCDYGEALRLTPASTGYYLDGAALASLGRNSEAIALLRERSKFATPVGGMQALRRSLVAYLEGDCAEAVRAVEQVRNSGMKDPEAHFYAARLLVHIGETDAAAEMLAGLLDQNYLCNFALEQDPWLAPLRGHREFAKLKKNASERREAAHLAFVGAGGEQVLCPSHADTA